MVEEELAPRLSNPSALAQKPWHYHSILRDDALSHGVAEVERRSSVVEELEAVEAVHLQRATHLRQSILQKAFTGELV